MPFKKRNRVFLFTILTVFALFLALPGCKEGTEKSPVSSFFKDINAANYTVLPEATTKYNLEGVVTNSESGKTLEGVPITLYYNGLIAMQKLTTSEGKYFFYDLPPAQYTLLAAENHKDFQPSSMIVEIKPDGVISAATSTFTLIPQPK